MNEINKYQQIKEIREQIRNLSFNLGDLVGILENELFDNKTKEIIEEQAWKMVEKINEVSNEDYGKQRN